MTQGVATKTASSKEASKKNSAILKLEPNPQAKILAKEKAAENPAPPPTEVKAEKPKTKSAAAKKPKIDKGEDPGGKLELGAGFSIKHKPRSAYSTLYQVVAKKGNFARIAEALAANKYDVSVKTQADELLSEMLVPVEKLEEWCRADESWQEHAKKKTESLKAQGDKAAKQILDNKARCADGKHWTGNIPEMISTCVGYYSYLTKKGKKAPKKPNKNVKKFQDAKIVFRRFDWEDRSFVMMFPEDYIAKVKQAIKISRGIDEDKG